MKSSDIPDIPILEFLSGYQGKWATHGDSHGFMPTVQDVMPKGTPRKLQISKMKILLRRGLVGGCPCGCRGDWEITDKGLKLINRSRTEAMICGVE